MTPAAPDVITPDGLSSLAELLRSRYGFHLEGPQLQSLAHAVRRRMEPAATASLPDYERELRRSDGRQGELAELISEFSNTETHFFRHPGRFSLLREVVLPDLRRRRGHPPRALRILSAGCATGEEVYSIVMTLLDCQHLWSGQRLEVIGCDINQRALAHAHRGAYSRWSVRFTPKDVVRRHFTDRADEELPHGVLDSVRRHTTFQYGNLAEDRLSEDLGRQQFDVIFCCNVNIYLSLEAAGKAVNQLCEMLVDEGFLFLGYAENLRAIRADFRTIYAHDYVVYQHQPSQTRAPQPEPAAGRSWPPAGPALAPAITPLLDSPDSEPADAPPPSSATLRPVVPYPPADAELEARYQKARKHLQVDLHQSAMSEIDDILKRNPFYQRARLLKAFLLGGRGELLAAATECTKVLDLDPMSSQAHLLLGMLLQQEGQTDNALRHVRNALYLEPNLPLGTFTLGKLYESLGDREAAVHEFARTIRLLEEQPDLDVATDIPSELGREVLLSLAEARMARIRLTGR